MAYGDTKGIMAGSEVVASGKELRVPVGKKLLGRIIDALGRPYDKKGPLQNDEYYPVVYISDKDIDDIEPGDTILMKVKETPDESKSWIYLDFDGYKESDYKVKLMVGQAAIWR